MASKIIVTSNWYNADLLDRFPNHLFVFGDNTKRYGKGGQAVIRDMPNSFGVATKVTPSMDHLAFFNDNNDIGIKTIEADIGKLKEICNDGIYEAIVFPATGLGTGLAQLRQRAPKTWEFLRDQLMLHFNVKIKIANYGLNDPAKPEEEYYELC